MVSVKKYHMVGEKKMDKIVLLKKTRLARGHFPSWDKIVLFTHFSQFYILFSTKFYFTAIKKKKKKSYFTIHFPSLYQYKKIKNK